MLKKGISYEAVLNFTEDEINTIIAVQAALDEREQEEIERQQRIHEQKGK